MVRDARIVQLSCSFCSLPGGSSALPAPPPLLEGGGWTENDLERTGPAAVPLGAVGLEYPISQRSGVDALSDAHLEKWLVWHWEVSPLLFLKM